jgi:rhodanese-related sulfurtransferase
MQAAARVPASLGLRILSAAPTVQQITAPELARMLDEHGSAAVQLLDVREPWEFEIARLAGSTLVPMQQVPAALDRFDPARPLVCICHHGVRSLQVAHYLTDHGFERVLNLLGGIDAWSRQVDPDCAVY